MFIVLFAKMSVTLLSRLLTTPSATKCQFFNTNVIAIKSRIIFNRFNPNHNYLSTLIRFKYSQNSGQKFWFSTNTQRSQRFNDILRNAIKDTDKSPKSTKSTAQAMTEWEQLKSMSLTKKLWFMFKKYWYISVPIHLVNSLLWFGAAYLVVQSGFDVKPILDWVRRTADKLPLPEFVQSILHSDANASSAGYVAIALILYKLTSPARYASTVGLSYYAINFCVKRGLIKPAPTGQELKASVIKSRHHLNRVLRERLAKREEMRKGLKPKNKKHK